MEIISIPAIVSLVFSLLEVYKKIVDKFESKEHHYRFLPIIGTVLGIIAGITCFYFFPNIIPAAEVFTAMFIGGASGLSATGCKELIKQLKKYGIKIESSEGDSGSDNNSGEI